MASFICWCAETDPDFLFRNAVFGRSWDNFIRACAKLSWYLERYFRSYLWTKHSALRDDFWSAFLSLLKNLISPERWLLLNLSKGGYFELVPNVTAPVGGNFVTINTVLLAPNSTGSVTLKTASAWDYPIMDANFFSTAYDKYVLSEGITHSYHDVINPGWHWPLQPSALKEAKRIASAPSMKGYIYEAYGALQQANTPSEVLNYIESYAIPNWQYVLVHRCPDGRAFTFRTSRIALSNNLLIWFNVAPLVQPRWQRKVPTTVFSIRI